jgi:hypothetical protein
MIQVPPNDENGLRELGEQLLINFPYLFKNFALDTGGGMTGDQL